MYMGSGCKSTSFILMAKGHVACYEIRVRFATSTELIADIEYIFNDLALTLYSYKL